MTVAELIVDETSQARGPAGKVIENVCKFFAICGGLVLTAMAIMSIADPTGQRSELLAFCQTGVPT